MDKNMEILFLNLKNYSLKNSHSGLNMHSNSGLNMHWYYISLKKSLNGYNVSLNDVTLELISLLNIINDHCQYFAKNYYMLTNDSMDILISYFIKLRIMIDYLESTYTYNILQEINSCLPGGNHIFKFSRSL